jgi:hypothetical protein
LEDEGAQVELKTRGILIIEESRTWEHPVHPVISVVVVDHMHLPLLRRRIR